MRGPTLLLALCFAGLLVPSSVAATATCAGDAPWVQLQLGAGGWSEAQRASVLSDLPHTLAGQGIAVVRGLSGRRGADVGGRRCVGPDRRAAVAARDRGRAARGAACIGAARARERARRGRERDLLRARRRRPARVARRGRRRGGE